MPKNIYLDYAAATPLDKTVAKKMQQVQEKIYGNPGSLHHEGRLAKQAVLDARKTIAKVLSCKPEEIIFTGSGTESDNLAIFGVARAYKNAGSHVICSAIEHHAVLNPVLQLEKEGFQKSIIKVDKEGILDLEDLKKQIKDSTTLVSVMYANNEIGTIQPIKEIANMVANVRKDREARNIATPIFFHTDACQAAGFLNLNVHDLGVDLLTLNGSKIYGPKGTGVLYIKTGINLEPILLGGGQEAGRRSGTENVVGIAGLAEALKIADKKRKSESARLAKLRDYFIKNLLNKIPKAVLNGHAATRLPNNVNMSVSGIEGEAMLLWLDKRGVCAATGSACDSRSLEASHVILALGRSKEYATGSIRFTLGRSTTKKDIDVVLKVFPAIVADLRRISPSG